MILLQKHPEHVQCRGVFLWNKFMLKLLSALTLVSVLTFGGAHAQNKPAPIQYVIVDRDFEKLETPITSSRPAQQRVDIVYFFAYTSPWSFEIDRKLRQWAASRPYPVRLSPSPASFGNPHEILSARIFFTLQELKVEPRVGPLFFEAVQKKHVDLTKMSSILNWMENQGISQEQFLTTINSNAVKSLTGSVPRVMRQYNVRSVPAVVIDGEYHIRAHQRQSAQRVFDVTTFMAENLSKGGARP